MTQKLLTVLSDDDEFLRKLGRLVLAASRFEKVLRAYATEKSPNQPKGKDPLGRLADLVRKSTFLSSTLDQHMMFAISQRNYFIHNLFERLDAYTSDDFTVTQFKSRLCGLVSELNFLSTLFEDAVRKEKFSQTPMLQESD